MKKIDSHISPKFYLNRWINPLIAHQNSVLVHPYSKYESIGDRSTDNVFFKKENYFATLDEGCEINNEIETIFNKSYETKFGQLIDSILINIEKTISKGGGLIKIKDEEMEQLYQFITQSYFRTPYGEVFGLTIMSLALQNEGNTDYKKIKVATFDHDFKGLIQEKEEKIYIDKTIFNHHFIKGQANKEILEYFKNMEIILLYAKGSNTKYITNDHMFSMIRKPKKGDTFLNQEYIIPLDPNLCIFIGGKRKNSGIEVNIQSNDLVQKINNTIYNGPISGGRIRYIISYSKEEIKRLIDLFGEIEGKD